MNWHKTKSIFIVCFLLLDLFLGFKMVGHIKKTSTLETTQNSNLSKTTLKKPDSLPPDPEKVSFLKGTQKLFINEKGELNSDIKQLESRNGQKIQTITAINAGKDIKSTLKDPVPVPESDVERSKLLNHYVYKGVEYHYWKKNSKTNTLLFIQTFEVNSTFKDTPVFIQNNDLSMLEFQVQNNEIVSYQQSYYEFSKTDNTIDTISPQTAVRNLEAKSEELLIGKSSDINVELGYINLVGDTNQLIFLPAWDITVKTDDGTKQFFVDAASGTVHTIDNTGGPS